MTDYTSLSSAEVRAISAAYFSKREAKSEARQQPTIVLVGAQPEAGKSQAAAGVRKELAQQGGFIHVDADRMRERIPLAVGSKPTSEQTQADAGRLAVAVRDLAIQGKRNIVEEGTFRNADGAARFIQDMHDKGYRVELVAVATAREESVLGIYFRHEQQHAGGTENPRFVPESYHDAAMQGFDATVAQNVAFLDRVRVTNRSGETLYDGSAAHNNQASASEALAAGRQLTDAKMTTICKDWALIEASAVARGAAPVYLAAVAGHAKHAKEFKSVSQVLSPYAQGKLQTSTSKLPAATQQAAKTKDMPRGRGR